MTPNPYPFIIPTLLVIPRFSCRCWLLAAGCWHCWLLLLPLLFCSRLPATATAYPTLPTPLPCPALLLLHQFLDRLTASPRLALHHLRQPPARATSSRFPPGRHHWNEQ